MSEIEIKKVGGRREMHDFIHVTDQIYRHCPQYVPDLESDVRNLFDRRKNPGLEFSDIQPFVAYRNGQPVGRVVGIVNRRANEKWQTQNVRFSMIEFLDDIAISKALLNAVEEWGRERGMTMIQGPLGITDFDKEGMLVEDFDMVGSMNTIYNPEYYPRHMEALGLKKEADWLQVRIDIPQETPARYARVAQYAREQIGLQVLKLSLREVLRQGYGQKLFELLNEAYQPIFGFSTLSQRQVDVFLKKYVRLIDLQLIPVIVNDKHEVVGVAITMGCLTQAMKKAGGRLLPFGWYHLLKALKWKREDHAEMLLIAIRPDYQGLGVNAMFFDDLIPVYNRYGFKWAETGPQLEYNVRELSQWKPLHPQYVKRRRCYKKQI
ncbi:MAG: N-acetyltransferase [Prevotella sp.]|nr:N-acetyltransferase [Prevotella sp.]